MAQTLATRIDSTELSLIQEDITRIAREVPGVEDVEIELTWDPPWTPERMSEDAKFILGIG